MSQFYNSAVLYKYFNAMMYNNLDEEECRLLYVSS